MTEEQRIRNIVTNVLADAKDEIIKLIENPTQPGQLAEASSNKLNNELSTI